jgi:aspartyl/asparaginyl beta-hydroxylase (cupin superfamily)
MIKEPGIYTTLSAICISFITKVIIVIIILIIFIALIIFMPKSTNIFDIKIYPNIENVFKEHQVEIDKNFKTIKNGNFWEKFSTNTEIYPIYLLNKFHLANKTRCSNLFNIINTIPNIKTFIISKVNPVINDSEISKSRNFNILNNTLRCAYILESPSNDIKKCFIWVDGDKKKIRKNEIIIFDSSREYSFYNKTDFPIYMILLDITRPSNIMRGSSLKHISEHMHKYVLSFI